MKKRDIVLRGENGEILYSSTRSKDVICGNMTLAEKLGADYLVLKDSVTGNYKKLTISNGTISLVDITVASEAETNPIERAYKNVLCLGNSITIHGLVANTWWGLWGMAASERSKDYVHQLESYLQANYVSSAKCYAVNIATEFERGTTTDLETLISETSTKDSAVDNLQLSSVGTVVIRLGENVTDTSTFETRLNALVASVKSYCPDATIVMTGNFWTNQTKEGIIEAVAALNDCIFVPIDQYDTAEYKQSVGNQVYGDDGQLHTITDSGVAIHPNDAGMAAIAEEIIKSLNL